MPIESDTFIPALTGFVTGPVAHIKGAEARRYVQVCRHGLAWGEGDESLCPPCSVEMEVPPECLPAPLALSVVLARRLDEELAARMPKPAPVSLTPDGWRETAYVPQPVLSAGDVQRVIDWAQTIGLARGLDPAEAALVLQLERWAHPEVWLVPPATATEG